MAKKIKFPIPKEDVPAWFMTYSDVITLLMTFFILLLTFSTTEPERFEKCQSSPSSTGGATGTAGKRIKGLIKDSMISRVRPSSARIAMRGAEMPPIMQDPVRETFGKGLESLDAKDRKHNEMTSHHFDVDFNRLFDSQDNLTIQGKQICRTLAVQLKNLPFQVSFQFTESANSPRVIKMMEFLFREEKTRPGQVALSYVKKDDLPNDKLRILIERYVGNVQ